MNSVELVLIESRDHLKSIKGAVGVVSFLTLKSPFCKYEVAKDQDNTEENNESDENEKEESKLAAVADSIKEGSYDIGYII